MSDFFVTLDGVEELSRKLTDVKPLRDGMLAGADHVKNKVQVYPPQSSRPQPFKTDKSRRWFFAALKDGRINVPYKRTRALNNRWATSVTSDGNEAKIGNNTPYAKIVQGRDNQSPYHKTTGWVTAEDTLEKEVGKVTEIVKLFIDRGLNG